MFFFFLGGYICKLPIFQQFYFQYSIINYLGFWKDLSTELGKVIESWRSLRLDPIEYRLVEVLPLTGRGKNSKFLL